MYSMVVKRITIHKNEKTKCKNLSKFFSGPSADALSEDAITSANILTKFSKDHANVKI